MNILVPCDPVNSREVEPDFADQAAAAERAGFAVHLLSFEDLVYESTPRRAVRRVPEDAGPCLYRGWMLKPPAYAALAAALDTRGAPLLVGPSAYVYAHQLPGWYSDFQRVTAPTVWTASGDLEEARAALRRLPPGPAIVKDYVKSAKHRWHEACFIPDTRDEVAALGVVQTFLDEQGADLNGGVVLRAYRPYPSRGVDERTGAPIIEERRVFLWRGRPLVIQGDEAALLDEPLITDALSRVRSPFVSLDVARLNDGRWEVVELGDGQVSGLRDMDPRAFFEAWGGSLMGVHPEPRH